MLRFETSATVQESGELRLVGIPFEPGTALEVTITPLFTESRDSTSAERAGPLLAALDKARNEESIGPLRRDRLYPIIRCNW